MAMYSVAVEAFRIDHDEAPDWFPIPYPEHEGAHLEVFPQDRYDPRARLKFGRRGTESWDLYWFSFVYCDGRWLVTGKDGMVGGKWVVRIGEKILILDDDEFRRNFIIQLSVK